MKRIVNLTEAKRRKILERDKYVCRYCGGRADQVDHIIPYTWSIINSNSNLVACCGRCNVIASNKVFDSVEEKRSYILNRRKKKGDRISASAPIETEEPIKRRRRVRKSEAKPKPKKHSIAYLLKRIDAKIRKHERTGHW